MKWQDKRNNKKELIFYKWQNVVEFKTDKWISCKVIRKADSLRSYRVNVSTGSTIRRNIWHLKPSFNEFKKSLRYNELQYLNEDKEEGNEESKNTDESQQGKYKTEKNKVVASLLSVAN